MHNSGNYQPFTYRRNEADVTGGIPLGSQLTDVLKGLWLVISGLSDDARMMLIKNIEVQLEWLKYMVSNFKKGPMNSKMNRLRHQKLVSEHE